MIESLSAVQIEETAHYVAWLEAAYLRGVVEELTIDAVNAILAEAAYDHEEG